MVVHGSKIVIKATRTESHNTDEDSNYHNKDCEDNGECYNLSSGLSTHIPLLPVPQHALSLTW